MRLDKDLKELSVWGRISPIELASSLLQKAEAFSKERKFKKSIAAFEQAAKLLGQIESALQAKDWELADLEEKNRIEKMRNAALVKRKYCLARIEMEEAKLRKSEGDSASAIQKYSSAVEKFEEIVEELRRRCLLGISNLQFAPFRGGDEDSLDENAIPHSIHEYNSKLRMKPRISNRIPTGYKPLDRILFGGIPEGHAVILTSPSCDERDALLRGFLENDAGHWVTFYVSTDINLVSDLIETYPSGFYAFLCNSQSDLVASEFKNVYGIKNVEDLSSINISLFSVLDSLKQDETIKGRRICISILSDVLLRCKALTSRKWLSDLIPRLKAKGFTILATLNPYMHPGKEASAVVDLFDGHVDIYEREDQDGTRVLLRVKRMLGQKYARREVMLSEDKLLRA